MTVALELKNVTKQFGSVIAMTDVSMEVTSGSVTCVLGDNGAGKSTLIKTLSGVHKATTGEFLMDGQPVDFNSPSRFRYHSSWRIEVSIFFLCMAISNDLIIKSISRYLK
jgi:ABC-type sugar transport system ATPase subunit